MGLPARSLDRNTRFGIFGSILVKICFYSPMTKVVKWITELLFQKESLVPPREQISSLEPSTNRQRNRQEEIVSCKSRFLTFSQTGNTRAKSQRVTFFFPNDPRVN